MFEANIACKFLFGCNFWFRCTSIKPHHKKATHSHFKAHELQYYYTPDNVVWFIVCTRPMCCFGSFQSYSYDVVFFFSSRLIVLDFKQHSSGCNQWWYRHLKQNHIFYCDQSPKNWKIGQFEGRQDHNWYFILHTTNGECCQLLFPKSVPCISECRVMNYELNLTMSMIREPVMFASWM